MAERDLMATERDAARWELAGDIAPGRMRDGRRTGVAGWIAARIDAVGARLMDRVRRRPDGGTPGELVAFVRTGGPIARWISYPRGVRVATAAISAAAAGLAAWGMIATVGDELGVAAAAAGAAFVLSTAAGPIGVRLANRLHRLVASRRRQRISELRAVADGRAVAVRGVVVARRTAASALDGRSAVWTLTRFRRGVWLGSSFFHEAAFDFLLDDGSDDPIWVDVAGGMLLDRFPPEERVQFNNTTLLELDHPFLTRLRLGERALWASEIAIAAGEAVEVVGRLSRRLDPTARSESGRDPPHRRVLQSASRLPVMIRKLACVEPALARVLRGPTKAPPSLSPGEPPMRKF
jgi:hypothetical protein